VFWVFDADRTTRFTFDASLDRWPTWSSDGTRILFDSTRKGRRDIYQKLSNVGTEEILVESAQDKTVTDESADGRYILYHSNDPQTNNDIWVLPTEGDRKLFVFS
jgi:Tol biopolymer transport system component